MPWKDANDLCADLWYLIRKYVPTKHRKTAQGLFLKEAVPQLTALFSARPTVTKLPTLREASLEQLLVELRRRNVACLYIGTRVVEGNRMVSDHAMQGPIEVLVAMHNRLSHFIHKKIARENEAEDSVGCPVED